MGTDPRGKGKKPTKVPFVPGRGTLARANDASTWGPFQAAEGMRGCDGVGLMLMPVPELAAIDIDHCRNKQTGEIAEWGERICEAAQSYVEITPSQEGLRILGIAPGFPPTIKTLQRPGGQVEVFCGGAAKYVTYSGERLDSFPSEFADISHVVAELLDEAETGKRKAEPSPKPGIDGSRADELIALLPNRYSRSRWVELAFAHKSEGGSFGVFDTWSRRHPSYDQSETSVSGGA